MYRVLRRVAATLIMSICFGVIVLASKFPGAIAAASSLNPPSEPIGAFASIEIRNSSQTAFSEWSRIGGELQAALVVAQSCIADQASCKSSQMLALNQLTVPSAGALPLTTIENVNEIINSLIKYNSDEVNYGVRDYWAMPSEAVEKGGDCEDYAIFKYLILRALGVSAGDLRIVVLEDLNRNIGHAVLVWRQNHTLYVLDNLRDIVVRDSSYPNYKPVYSVNEQYRWTHINNAELRKNYFGWQSLS